MTRGQLVLAGGTVCMIAIGAVKRKRRPARDTVSRRPHRASDALTLYALTFAGGIISIDLPGLFGSIWDFLGNTVGEIKDFVFSVVGTAVNQLKNAVQVVIDAVEWTADRALAGVGMVADLSHTALSAVAGVVTDTYAMLDGAFSNFRQQIKDLFEGFWHDFKSILGDLLPDFIGDFFGELWDFLKALAGIGMDGVVFLINLVDDPINFLWMLLKDLVDEAIEAAKDTFEFGWAAFWGLFWPLLARQLGLPEDPEDMIAAAKLLFTFALALVTDSLDDWGKDHGRDVEQWLEKQTVATVNKYSDTIVAILYEVMGIDYPASRLKEATRQR